MSPDPKKTADDNPDPKKRTDGKADPTDAADSNFQEATGMVMDMATEEYHEGGQNAYVHRLPNGVKGGTLVLKRGLVLVRRPLYAWCADTLQGGLAGQIVPKVLTVQLLAPGSEAAFDVRKSWCIMRAWPTKWEISGFNAQDGQVLIESLEFAYTRIGRLKPQQK